MWIRWLVEEVGHSAKLLGSSDSHEVRIYGLHAAGRGPSEICSCIS